MKKIILSIFFLVTIAVFTLSATETSDNNDKFWYTQCLNCELDDNGNPVQSTIKSSFPSKGMFEIQFVYSDSENIPVLIYLNEIDEGNIISSTQLGGLLKNAKSTVKFKDDTVNLFTANHHICVTKDGSIIVYYLNNGRYANGKTSIFEPNDIASVIYGVRYDVLVQKLKEIF